MDWFPRAGEARTRGHRFKARGGIVHRNLRDNYFKQRVVGIWYKLPEGGVYMVHAARGWCVYGTSCQRKSSRWLQ